MKPTAMRIKLISTLIGIAISINLSALTYDIETIEIRPEHNIDVIPFITENSAAYVYTGVEWNYTMSDKLKFTPSFAPGIYHEGDGKDLGHALEFKTEVQLSYSISESTNLGMSYNHISNASLGDKNPGANSYMFNLLKNF